MKNKKWADGDLALCGLFSALTAVGAFIQVTIPVQPTPMHITLQFFFVLLAGLLLGARRSLASVGVYLAVGLCGIPVFASGGGPAYLLKPTFGFLLGFAAAAFTAGAIFERQRRITFPGLFWAALGGLFADYGCGMVYFYFCSNYVLHVQVGWKLVFINCFLLTVWADLVLCVLAAALARRLVPVIGELTAGAAGRRAVIR